MKKHVVLSLRLPPDLHRQLTDSAKARFTSMNREIIERLISSFKSEFKPAEPIDLEELQRRLTVLERALFGEDQ